MNNEKLTKNKARPFAAWMRLFTGFSVEFLQSKNSKIKNWHGRQFFITFPLLLVLCSLLPVFPAFAQQEIPMFFDGELGLAANNSLWGIYSPDGSKIAIAPQKGKISIWDATTGREITRLSGHGDKTISAIVFSPNGRQLASCAERDSVIKIWDTASGTLIRSISHQVTDIWDIAFSPDSSRIAGAFVSGNNYGVKIWNTANGSEVRTLTGHTKTINSVIYSPDGKQILTTSFDSSIRIWDAGNGQIIRTINSENIVYGAVYSPNGQYIAANILNTEGNSLEAILIYNVATGQQIRSILARSGIPALAYSPDNRQLIKSMFDTNDNYSKIS